MKKIGIFGGTFDPPHLGHLHMAQIAYKELALDKVYFIPNRVPAYKLKEHGISSPEDRLNMLRLMLEEASFGEINTIELDREGNTYTSDTLRQLKKTEDNELYLIIGSDSFKKLSYWHEPKEVFRLSKIVVLLRNDDDFLGMKSLAEEYKEHFGAMIYILNNNIENISSTELRRELSNGEWNKDYLPQKVFEYINYKHLYT